MQFDLLSATLMISMSKNYQQEVYKKFLTIAKIGPENEGKVAVSGLKNAYKALFKQILFTSADDAVISETV